MRFGIGTSLSLSRSARALGLQGLDAGDLATDFLDPRGTLELVGRGLEAHVELLPLELDELFAELVVGFRPQVLELAVAPGGRLGGLGALLRRSHHSPPRCEVSPRRATTLVLIGSFIAARLNDSAAIGPGSPTS